LLCGLINVRVNSKALSIYYIHILTRKDKNLEEKVPLVHKADTIKNNIYVEAEKDSIIKKFYLLLSS
jgi:hypothetical protein